MSIPLIALDMDGVVNSTKLIRTWIESKYGELSHIEDPIKRRMKAREEYLKAFADGYEAIFPELAERVARICDSTGAHILWSSTWRNSRVYSDIEFAKGMFNRRGLPGDKLIGYTPDFGGDKYRCSRALEISYWLTNRTWNEGKDVRCAVIDDRLDAGAELPEYAKLFATDEYVGITDNTVEEVIAYLKG